MYVLKSLLATVLGFYSEHIWGNLSDHLRKGLFFTDSELNIYMNSENHEKTWLRHCLDLLVISYYITCFISKEMGCRAESYHLKLT